MASGAILLQWRDRNWAEHGHYIYRSQAPMDTSNLPNPIATVGVNEVEYIDYDVVEGDTYYYRIGAFRNNDIVISDEVELVAGTINEIVPDSNHQMFFDARDEYQGDRLSVPSSTYGASVYNNDINVDGSISNYIQYDNRLNVPIGSFHFTINYNGGVSNSRGGVIFGTYIGSNSINIELNATRNLRYYYDGGAINYYSNYALPLNRDVHISVVRRDGQTFIYYDGVLRDTINSMGADIVPATPPYLGRDTRTSYPFHGKIGLFIADALSYTDSEIADLHDRMHWMRT